MTDFSLQSLADLIDDRATSVRNASYTRNLLDAGVEKCAKKFGEEAIELVIAAVGSDKKAIILESADVLYHLLVVLQANGIALQDVMVELQRRTAQSGIEEKASRKN
ncbi:MAG: phosphoribosyl-ATP diphosphatase [Hyphomicrobiales bacterium]|nr:phosphoribosyl-ATP diphosphatase [Hyphomicrobiales bacterium]MDE2114140.1 phosphoribosyl-ATP diphosphatase [Hyphomicrobiales bacterium]